MSETNARNGWTIFVVEDDKKLCRLIEKNLKRVGFQTEFAYLGSEAISKINGEKKTLILLDYRLPDMTGKKIVERLLEKGSRVPFIVMTGQGDEKIAVEMMKLGACDYIVKDRGFLDLLPQVIKLVIEQLTIEKRLDDTEVRLRESQRTISTLMKNLLGMAYRCKNDVDRTIIFASEGCKNLTGHPLSNIGGISYTQFIRPNDRKKVFYEIQSALKEKNPFQLTYRIQSADGKEKWVLEKGTGVFSKDGEIKALEGFILDITEQKKAEEALQESEEKYRTIIENIEEGYYEISNDGKLTFFNDSLCNILGFSENELIGADNTLYMNAEQAKKVFLTFIKVYQTKKPIKSFNWEIIRKDGTKRYLEVSVSPKRSSTGKILGFRGITRDITDRKRAEEEREMLVSEISEKNQDLEQFIHAISHDLRAPLVNVHGFSKELDYTIQELASILQTVDAPVGVKEELNSIFKEGISDILQVIQASISKMDNLLSGLLRLSRLGRAALTFENLDMNLLLSEIEKSFEFRAKKTGIDIRVGELPPCIGDAVQINQVFSNLIDNALKYHDPEKKGFIKITGKRNEGRVVYCVEDNGIGIPETHQRDVFMIFHRVDSKSTEGEGLGLSLVSKILNRNNGMIWVESEEGVGSKFFVSLPSTEGKIEKEGDSRCTVLN